MKKLDQIILDGIDRAVYPGAVMCLYNDGKPLILKAYGHRMITPQRLPMYENTLFDMASLTKAVATSTSVMILKEQGKINLDDDLADHLPGFTSRGISIFHLLIHTSGLPAWRALYIEPGSNAEKVKYLSDLPLEYETSSKVIYSCLGYILLGEMVRHVTGMGLDEFALKHIFRPLGMEDTFFNPPEERRSECAATEDSNSFEKRMTNYRSYKWREGVVVGEVHDENANSLGGVAGNAGLFSTASDMGKFCRMIINDGEDIISPESVRMMSTSHTEGLDGSRSVGWGILDGDTMSHTGFTGTAIRIYRNHRSAAILLTNRVHPDATKEGIGEVRERFYAEVKRSYE